MFCDKCLKVKVDNAFTRAEGCDNFRTSTLTRHVKTWHKLESPAEDTDMTIMLNLRHFFYFYSLKKYQ